MLLALLLAACNPVVPEFNGSSSADLEARIAALEDAQAEQAAELDELRADVYDGLADLHEDEAAILALREDLGATQADVDELDAATEANGQAIEVLVDRVDTLWTAVEALQR